MTEIRQPSDIQTFLVGCSVTCTEHQACRITLMERARCFSHYLHFRDSHMIKAILDLEPVDGSSKLVNVRCPLSGKILLFEAIAAEDITVVERLLRLGANVHQTSYQGETPLQIAAKCSNKAIERIVQDNATGLQLQHDVLCGILRNLPQSHVNFRNPINGNTALHLCLFSMPSLPNKDRERRIALLLALGADPFITNHDLVRPIDILCENWHNLPMDMRPSSSNHTSEIKQLILEASENQRFNRGVLNFHKSNYITVYDSEGRRESITFCQRALVNVL